MIVIYDPSGKELIETVVSDRSSLYTSIDNRKELTLVFSLDRLVDIPIGSWCDFEGNRYELMREADVKMVNTVGYSYSVVFSSEFARISLFKVVNTVDGRMKFDMVAKPIEHLQMIVDNLNERDYGWSIGGCIESVEKSISYNHTSCDKALADIAGVFETEVEVSGKTISLGKIEYNKDNPIELSYGKDKGIRSGVTKTNDGALPVRRLFVQGGSRNISLKDYGSAELHLPKELEFDFDGEFFNWENGFDVSKAKKFVTDRNGSYLEVNDEKAIREDSIDLTHVYPSREGKVSEVIFVYRNNDYPAPLGSWTEEDLNAVQIDIVDSTIPDSLDYNECLLENNEPLTVVFQSGMLAGREFSATYVSDKKRFRLVKQEFDGQPMPQGLFIPEIGDTYAVFNVSLPASYISDPSSHTGAEYTVLREASRSLYDLSEKKFSFSGEIDGIWSKKNWDSVGSRIRIGSYVRFTHDKMFPDNPVMVRIVGITQYVNNPYSPKIEISNNVGVSSLSTRLNAIENQEAHVEELHKESKRYAKRRFSDVSQTLDMLKGAFDNFSEGINPVTVETMSMLVGDERLQFVFTESLSSDVEKGFSYSYKSKADVLEGEDESKVQGKNQIVIGSAFIKHMTLGIDSISPVHASNEYKRWALPEKRFLLDPAKGYYIYAHVEDGSSAGEFVVSDSALKDDGSSHYLLIGILNSEYDGQRSFARMYGYTEVRPGQIVTEEIRSSDGKTWLDLVKGILHLNDLAGVSGIKDTQKGDKSIAAWFGGLMEDIELDKNPVNPAKSVLRHDGTGYFAEGNIRWDKEGGAEFGGGDFKILPNGSIVFGKDIKISSDGDETLGSILTILATLTDMFEWADKEHSAIKTKYPLFSEKTISSGGKGEDGQGGGGSGVVVMDSWDEFDATLPQVLGAILGIELHNRLTALESGNADSPYATIAFVEKTISDLIGGADSAYDTLLKIQQILQGNEASIGSILEEIAKKASKDKLEEVSDKVDDHDTRISDLEEKNDMFHFVTDADGTTRIKTEYPLFSTMTIASGGKGEKGEGGGGTGTVMAVEVNGEIHDAEDGIVTLPDYPTKAEYDGKIAELDTKVTQHGKDIETIKPKVEKNVNDIGDLQRVDEDIKNQLADIKKITDKFSYEEDGDILKTGSNLVSLKTVGSGGRGEEGSGGDSGSSGTLDGLLDVTIDFGGATKEEEEGQVLAYDAESFEWKNRKTMHRHPQGVASDVWVITHNLNKVPNVKIIDSTGEQVFGTVKIGGTNNEDPMNMIRVIFGGAFSGTAYLD